MALIISEHRLHQFLPVADEFVYLQEGRIAARWDVEKFTSLSEHETAKFGLRHPDMKSDSEIKSYPAKDADGWHMTDVTYLYPSTKRGIKGITAEFPFGSVTVICGENGTGKTTLAKVLVGAAREQRGIVARNGKHLSRKERRLLSYFVMQDVDYQLYAGSVADEVVLGRQVDDALKARAWEALTAFGLTDLADDIRPVFPAGRSSASYLQRHTAQMPSLLYLTSPQADLTDTGCTRWCIGAANLHPRKKQFVVITHDELLAQLAGDYIVDLSLQKRG